MKTYGIFDGVARDGVLVAAAVYDFATWQEITGSSDLEEYRDFLAEQEAKIAAQDAPAYVVRVPFDPEAYSAWLRENTFWRDGPEARSAWALEVARDPEARRRLEARLPALPRPPENVEDVDVYYSVLLVYAERPEDVLALAPALGGPVLERLGEVLWSCVPVSLPFRRVSRLRVDGLRFVLGNRFLLVPAAQEIEDLFEAAVRSLEGSVWEVPRHYRIRRSQLEGVRWPVLVPVLLPVAAHGGEDCLMFLNDHTAARASSWKRFGESVRDAAAEMLGKPDTVQLDYPLVWSPSLESHLEDILDAVGSADEEDDEDGGDVGGPGSAGSGVRLRRVK